MIIFILVIHAGGAKGHVVCVAEKAFAPCPRRLPPVRERQPSFFQWGGKFSGVKPIQGNTFSGRLNIL